MECIPRYTVFNFSKKDHHRKCCRTLKKGPQAKIDLFKVTEETIEKVVKYPLFDNKDTKKASMTSFWCLYY